MTLLELEKDLQPAYGIAKNDDFYYIVPRPKTKNNTLYSGIGAVCRIDPLHHSFTFITGDNCNQFPFDAEDMIGLNKFDRTGLSNIEVKAIKDFANTPIKNQKLEDSVMQSDSMAIFR